jgi:hypothetical protein
MKTVLMRWILEDIALQYGHIESLIIDFDTVKQIQATRIEVVMEEITAG